MGDEITPAAPMTKAQAKKVTTAIRQTADDLWDLLRVAHEGQAWVALGYPTWGAYVETEFNMTRRNANRLVAQAEVIKAIEAAGAGRARPAPDPDAGRARPASRVAKRYAAPPVSARQAADIRRTPGALSTITDAVTKGASPGDAVKAAAPVETHSRGRHVAEHHAPERIGPWPEDPQKALPAVLDALEESIGGEATEKLVKLWLSRRSQVAMKTNLGPINVMGKPIVNQATCSHPKAREDKKPYGVWCGVCRKKIR